MPGVLIVEAMAQAAAVLSFKTMDAKPNDESVYYFAGIDSARFKKPVSPGDQIVLNVKIDRILKGIWKYTGVASVDNEVVAEASMMCILKAIGSSTLVLCGGDALNHVSSHEDVDVVMAAIVGAAGLHPAMAAAKAGKRILLANKETLVMAGDLFMQAVVEGGATLLPIDSEHNAIFQVMPRHQSHADNYTFDHLGIRRILLTASGGPFRNSTMDELKAVTLDQALQHPNWVMGPKITIDSATMMNKGLEIIEARWLFNAQASQIEVVVHPQSVIHSMVEYIDGSVLAQLGNPDMRTPIAVSYTHLDVYKRQYIRGLVPLF